MAKRKYAKQIATRPELKNEAEAAECERSIAEALGQLMNVEQSYADEIRRLQAEAEQMTIPKRRWILTLAQALRVYADQRRNSLTANGKSKSGTIGMAGTVGWLLMPGRIKFTVKVEKVLSAMKTLKWNRFIRTKEEPDKEAMLKNPEMAAKIPGVKIVRGEKFVIRPSGTKARVEQDPEGAWSIVTDDKETLDE